MSLVTSNDRGIYGPRNLILTANSTLTIANNSTLAIVGTVTLNGGAVGGGGPGGLVDGDMGDIVVSGGGTILMFDSTVVTPAAKTLLDDASTAVMRTTLSLDQVNNTTDANKPVSTATQTAINAKADKLRIITTYSGAATTGALTDGGCYLRFTNATATFTVPTNAAIAFPVGTQIDGIGAAGAMTIAASGGVTINKARTLVTLGANSGWTLIKVATDTWDLHGDFV